jgi:hypothetical protein
MTYTSTGRQPRNSRPTLAAGVRSVFSDASLAQQPLRQAYEGFLSTRQHDDLLCDSLSPWKEWQGSAFKMTLPLLQRHAEAPPSTRYLHSTSSRFDSA